MVRDSAPPGSASIPLRPAEPAKLAAFPLLPETPAVPQTAPVVMRTIHKGDQIAKVAREVYGVCNPAVLAWIKQNNPHLQNVNHIDVGMHLTFPPLPGSSPRKVRGEMRNQ